MKPLDELIDNCDPGIKRVQEDIERAKNQCIVLPPSNARDVVLVNTQVTTRSTMGAIVYETGGILIDHGWLRFLGSGNSKLNRSLPEWNVNKANGFYLVADDAAGGFFAINGGALGSDVKNIYYWAPDSFEWEPLEMGYTSFFHWSLIGNLEKFYTGLRWQNWTDDVSTLPGDRCYSFYPFLWTEQGSVEKSYRNTVPVEEAFNLKVDILDQLSKKT